MSNMHNVVTSLRAEYNRLQKDLERVGKALHALGTNGSRPGVKRILSKEARERIAEAQRQRWAKVRKQQNAKS